jgi:hypothetical protein
MYHLLFLEKRQSVGDALVRIGRGDVVSVATDDDESRIRNLHLIGPRSCDPLGLTSGGYLHIIRNGGNLHFHSIRRGCRVKILMFGRGVIATTYGWALAAAGHEVEFYVRPGRAKEYGEAITLDLLDARRRFQGQRVSGEWSVQYRETLEPDHDFDLIVLSVQHYRVGAAVRFLASRLGNATLLMFSNMCSEPEEIAEGLPQDQLAWGFPQAGGGFDENGVLRAALLKSVFLGRLIMRPPNGN